MVHKDPNPDKAPFAARMQAARQAVALTQQQVADHCGVDVATVSAWETARADPGSLRVAELSRLYNTTTDALILGHSISMEAARIASSFDALPARQKQTFYFLWLALVADAKSEGVLRAAPQDSDDSAKLFLHILSKFV